MVTSEFISNAYLHATGEVATFSPSDDEWKKLVAFGNFYINNWANELGVDWASLYDPAVDCGTVGATDTFDLDDTIRIISNQPDDYVEITHTDGKVSKYETVPPKNLKRYATGNYCAKIGQTLVFNKKFTADDPQFGGKIAVPAYLYPTLLKNASDTVPVDNPNWLVFVCASKWVQTDVTLAQNRPDLVSEALDALAAMKRNNQAQVDTIVRSSATRGV